MGDLKVEQVYGKNCRVCNVILTASNTTSFYVGRICIHCYRIEDNK